MKNKTAPLKRMVFNIIFLPVHYLEIIVPFHFVFKMDGCRPASLGKILPFVKTFGKLFPFLPFKTDFKWAGTFASTKDGLPFIGNIPERPRTYFVLGLRGNGIIFSEKGNAFSVTVV